VKRQTKKALHSENHLHATHCVIIGVIIPSITDQEEATLEPFLGNSNPSSPQLYLFDGLGLRFGSLEEQLSISEKDPGN
jgi:hypothetical protein